MTFEKYLFYFFATITVIAATMVITRRNPVHSVLFLVLAFFSSAALWLLLEAEFLAIKGVGEKKAADLGPIFLAAIAEFLETRTADPA